MGQFSLKTYLINSLLKIHKVSTVFWGYKHKYKKEMNNSDPAYKHATDLEKVHTRSPCQDSKAFNYVQLQLTIWFATFKMFA